jgi:phosphoenolpyruvate carboxykinase (ATP)
MIRAAISGQLKKVPYDRHPVFGVEIPSACAGVPSEMLYTRDTWINKDAYDEQALMLAKKFIKNFEKYEAGVEGEVRAAAPMT